MYLVGKGKKAEVNGMYLISGSTKEDEDHSSQKLCTVHIKA